MFKNESPFKFKPGQRVRPSKYGIRRLIFTKTRHNQTGALGQSSEKSASRYASADIDAVRDAMEKLGTTLGKVKSGG